MTYATILVSAVWVEIVKAAKSEGFKPQRGFIHSCKPTVVGHFEWNGLRTRTSPETKLRRDMHSKKKVLPRTFLVLQLVANRGLYSEFGRNK